ncbi:MAG: hypothetical protein IT548_01320 [Alphaproteobacteria bacterium]|nr:hypothetical protein [Alphaproteobacteria bacterium]
MLAFKIRYRPVERGQPRKVELVPVWESDAPPRPAVRTVDERALAGEGEAPPSVH